MLVPINLPTVCDVHQLATAPGCRRGLPFIFKGIPEALARQEDGVVSHGDNKVASIRRDAKPLHQGAASFFAIVPAVRVGKPENIVNT